MTAMSILHPDWPNTGVPTDATRVGEWMPTTDGMSYVRLFDGTQRQVADVRIDIVGAQRIDGRVFRFVVVGSLDDAAEPLQYEAARARRLANETYAVAEVEAIEDPDASAAGFEVAATLIAAADEIERLESVTGAS